MSTRPPWPAPPNPLTNPPSEAFAELLDALPIGVAVALAPSGELLYASASYVELLGVPERARTGAGAAEPLAPGSARGVFALHDRQGAPFPEERTPFARALREQRVVEADDIAIARPDGTHVYVRAFARPLFDAGGRITHVLLALTNISAEVNAERESESTRERLMIALQHTPIALFTADERGTVTVSEGAALASLGFEPGQLVGSNVFETYAAMPDILDNLRRAYAGESFTVTTRIGETVLESWMAPLRAAGSNGAHGIIGVSTDITERLRLQNQVAHADRVLVLGRIAASVAHEINNPLAYTIEALRMANDLAERLHGEHAADDPIKLSVLHSEIALLRQVLVDAADGADRVRLITRDLKVFARPEDDERKPISLDAALRTAARFVARRTDERARVQLELGSNASVLTSESRLVQIFTNLLLNAADALSTTPIAQNVIRVTTRCEGEHAITEIADSGPGIAEGLYAQVFEPFFTSKAAREGTGLGLYVTRTLVEGLHGRIEVGRAPEGGALFRVSLPCGPELAPEPAIRPSTLPPPSRRPRVLVIDDEAMITRVFRASLEAECDVEIAQSGRRALERLVAGERFDCIFCDLMMGDLNGAALYRALKDEAPGREDELIFMTGGVYDQSVAELLDSVPNRCIDKPFDIRAEVLAIVGERERAERRALRGR